VKGEAWSLLARRLGGGLEDPLVDVEPVVDQDPTVRGSVEKKLDDTRLPLKVQG
jgi:hypothetical protein